ncbi:MAG: transposase [Hespellia sp.]|nr:transposase [Hespellia sp.]
MPSNRMYKTVHQFNKEPISEEDMRKLLDVAEDYRTVKNYVYRCYGGIAGLSKIYPGYTVQNEMTASGFRETLRLPSVYFYLAMFEALGEIRSRWTNTKTQIAKLVGRNEHFTEEEKHYLRFLLKVSNAFEAALNQKPIELPENIQKQYVRLAEQVDVTRMHRYLCRQVRKYHKKLHTECAEGFAIAERAYRYADHGIYLSIKEKRKRVFVPLTDKNQYSSQLYVKLYPAENRIEIQVPISVKIHRHETFQNRVGLAVGFYTMLTTDQGHSYGVELGSYQLAYSDWIRTQASSYSRNKKENPGRKKYYSKKKRLEDSLHHYINRELNRFFQEEQPKIVYIVKLPKPQAGGKNKKINHSISQWQRGYIRKRLTQKCQEQSVEIVEVLGKDISNECSNCGAMGKKHERWFGCPVCGYRSEEKWNTARNVKRRGEEMGNSV